MNARMITGMIVVMIVLWGTILTREDYRRGVSRFWLSGGVSMFTFRRDATPRLFWASLITNILFIGAVLMGAIGLIALPVHS
jgi:hypothetical protein